MNRNIILIYGSPETHPSSLWSPAVVHERCQEPRSYVLETPNGRMLRRNGRHIQEAEPAKKAVRFGCESPNTQHVLRTAPNIEHNSQQSLTVSRTDNGSSMCSA